MAQKGTKIGEKTVTLKRDEDSHNRQNVYHRIYLDGTGVDKSQDIFVNASCGEWSSEWECSVYDTELAITLPKRKIEKGKLRPGESVKFEIYEVQEFDLVESDSVIGRANAQKSGGGDVSCRLNSKDVYNYIESRGGNAKIECENLRTQKITTYRSKSHSNKENGNYRFSFPKAVRNELDTQPDDLIEIRSIDKEKKLDNDEKIEEIHSMVCEMYDAYLESKND
jgi:hypothetical protein